MAAKKQKYEVDLAVVFDRAFQGESRDIKNQLRPLINNAAVKSNIGREVIRRIRERTLQGIDRFDSNFKEYSPEYIDSFVFSVHSKSASPVNLTLSGQMLANMQSNALSRTPKIVVDFISKEQNAKADGHITGGGRTKNGKQRLPIRNFFGLPKDEEEDIVKTIIEEAALQGAMFDPDEVINIPESINKASKTKELDFWEWFDQEIEKRNKNSGNTSFGGGSDA